MVKSVWTAREGQAASRGANQRITRYLCAAVHLDPAFAAKAYDQLFRRTYQALAPCYGVDLEPVAKHVLWARRRSAVRHALLVALLLLVGFVALRAAVTVYRYTAYFGSVPSALVASAAALLGGVIPLLFWSWIIVLADEAYTRHWVLRRMAGGSDLVRAVHRAAPLQPQVERRIAAAQQETGNVVTYSGWNPFVGCGVPTQAWSFAVELRPAKKDAPVLPFLADDAHRAAHDVLAGLVPGMSVSDRIYISGQDVAFREDLALLPQPFAAPVTALPEATVRRLGNEADLTARRYSCFQVRAWEGEIVVSMFVRCLLLEDILFLEFSVSVLGPVHDRYRRLDARGRWPLFREVVDLLRTSLRAAPLAALSSPSRLLHLLMPGIRDERERQAARKEIAQTPWFDYGTSESLREAAMTTRYSRYFQALDKDMYVKSAERRLLSGLATLLEERGYDTSEFEAGAKVIQEGGIYMGDNATFNAQNVAVGKDAAVNVGGAARARAAGGKASSDG